MRHEQGLTLLEMLVAMLVLVIVLGMASAGVIMALQAQRGQEAVTSSQAKLRRVNEAVLQELRGAVLGGVTSDPIASGRNSVSFTVIDGGAGYEVKSVTNTQLTFVAATGSAADFSSGQVLLVNGDGIARVLAVQGTVESALNLFTLNHAACSSLNPFPVTSDTLMFKVRTIGFRYDDAQQKLFQRVGSGGELPLAFGMNQFDIDYIYQKNDGSYVQRTDPYLDADPQPDRTGLDSEGNLLNLVRLNITLGTSAPTIGGRTVERRYTGQLDLAEMVDDARFRAIKGVSPCN